MSAERYTAEWHEEQRRKGARIRSGCEPLRCECRGRGCWCETEPRTAVFSVLRDGQRINVCDRCDMTEDKDIRWLEEVTPMAPDDVDRMYARAWWLDHMNLARLLHWLDARGDGPDPVEYLEKPWKWEPEWEEMNRELSRAKGG